MKILHVVIMTITHDIFHKYRRNSNVDKVVSHISRTYTDLWQLYNVTMNPILMIFDFTTAIGIWWMVIKI